jgi:hypothetical protein
VVLILATKPLTCAHINSIGLVKTEDTMCPNINQKKSVLQNYLTQHNISFTDTKKVLYKKKRKKNVQQASDFNFIAYIGKKEILQINFWDDQIQG